MAWFLNHYECSNCEHTWTDEWSCMCDDDCPKCGARHMSPHESDDLTDIIAESEGSFVVFRSPKTAEHRPAYREIARFPTAALAGSYVADADGPD
jgi:predicted  nucleic acid-binding Zn-ribbon protein